MALQFNPPPDWLISEYMNRPSPYEEANQGIQQALQSYVKMKELKKTNLMQNELLALKRNEDRRQGREAFYSYGDIASLSPAERASMAPVQGPLPEGQAGPLQATYDPNNPAPHFNEFLKKFPQGIRGREKGNQNETYTPEESAAILRGELLDKPASIRVLGKVQAARGQQGIQERFEERIEETKRQKGAAAELKSGENLKQIQEAKDVLNQLTQYHSDIVGKGKGGNPLSAFVVGTFAKATGGAYGTDDVLAYNNAVNGMITRMKSVTGNVGMVTEFDQARLEALTPRLGENVSTVQRKMKIINEIFDLTQKGELSKLDNYLRSIGVKTHDSKWNLENQGSNVSKVSSTTINNDPLGIR